MLACYCTVLAEQHTEPLNTEGTHFAMYIPPYWLPRPAISWSSDVTEHLEKVFALQIKHGTGAWIDEPLPIPVWAFCCWLTDYKGLLLHGSANPNIAEFYPRTPNDNSADTFSKQTAVFAASDGIWPMFYAILNRQDYRLRMLNGALQFELPSGAFTAMHYFFSVTQHVLARGPWRSGVLYILPREEFQQQPPHILQGRSVNEPHWARLTSVRPLAKLKVTPDDFPFLAQVRGHDDTYIQLRAATDPNGFPWLDED